MTARTHLWLPLHRRDDLPQSITADHPVWSAHRRLRGPYTFGGTLARAIVPAVQREHAELVALHEVTLLTLAPELRETVPATKETLTSLAVPSERTRFYSRLRTLRLAHGLAAFLRDLPDDTTPSTIVIRDAHHADQTDAELIAVLLRRLDPERLRLIVCTGLEPVADFETESPEPLPDALAEHTTRLDPPSSSTPVIDVPRFVADDCLDDGPEILAAYESVDAGERAAMHDARAEALLVDGEFTHRVGAIPFHREHGTDPKGAGVAALREALDHCIDVGFYEATVDLGRRGRRYVSAVDDSEQWWAFTTKMTTSLAALARASESEALYNDARATSISPSVHQQAAYATAMLYTRHHEDDTRDDLMAKAWINQAIAIASLLPDEADRAFHSAFYRNGLALIELHLGDPQAALDLVEDGLSRLDNALAADRHALHRSVLRYNRAQVLGGLGRVEEALADYDAVIDVDPNYPEYHFDRAALLRRLGREVEALADYDEAIRLSPPFPEAYFNRSVTRAAIGDVDGALDDLNEVIVLEPGNVVARVNRAELLLERGESDSAENDVRHGLSLVDGNAELHVLAGHLARERGDDRAAIDAYTTALTIDVELTAALTARAETHYALGDLDASIADLDAAIELDSGSVVARFNRAVVAMDLGRHGDALTDLEEAAKGAPDDPDITQRLADCRETVGAVS
ncbi:tetratricopeptide repeat protein [Stackebrandtia soli]|uniref:tetratricopeptide repeat protein n=1 Tax=Stackebrandtia soli TaxID=1892856 RepID=UPI0039EA316B